MLHHFRIGAADVYQITEYVGPTHVPGQTLAGFDRAEFDRLIERCPPGGYFRSVDRLVIAMTIWVVKLDDKVVVVDTGVGNGKERPAARMRRLNTLVLEWLRAIGAGPDQVTHVVLTHLHNDHLGWCTVLQEGEWIPTFPNATYLAPARDIEVFGALYEKDGGATDGGSYADAILPLLKAGQLSTLTPGDCAAGFLDVGDVGGHTPGMVSYALGSQGEKGMFCGDVVHHPVQICQPDWNTVFCMEPARALETRRRVLGAAADNGIRLLTCHLSLEGGVNIARDGAGFRID